MASQMFSKFEVPRFYKLPVLKKPRGNAFPINLRRKDFQEIQCFLSFAVSHEIERDNSVVPVLTLKHKARKQKPDLLLCG